MTRESKDIESKNDETTQLTHGGRSDIKRIEKKSRRIEKVRRIKIYINTGIYRVVPA